METFAEKVARYKRVADLRGVATRNPVVITEVYNGTLFKIVVAYEEPSNNSLPALYLLWLCVNPDYNGTTLEAVTRKAYPNWYGKMLRRTSLSDNLPNSYNRNTWQSVTTIDTMFNDPQTYDLHDVFLLGELVVGTPLPQATTLVSGTVKMNGDFTSKRFFAKNMTVKAGSVTTPDGGLADLNSWQETTVNGRHFRAIEVDVESGKWYTLSAIVRANSINNIGLLFFDFFVDATSHAVNSPNTALVGDSIWKEAANRWDPTWSTMDKDSVGCGLYYTLSGNGTFVANDDRYTVAGVKKLYDDALVDITPLSDPTAGTVWYQITASRFCYKSSTVGTNKARVGICAWKSVSGVATSSYAGAVNNGFFVWDCEFIEGKLVPTIIRGTHNIVVADNDPRMTNNRFPKDAHINDPDAHPKMPAEEFVAYGSTTISVGESGPPVSGNVLVVGADGKASWKALHQADIQPDDYHAVSSKITSTNVTVTKASTTTVPGEGWVFEDATTAQLGMNVTFQYDPPSSKAGQQFSQIVAPVTWTIPSGTYKDGAGATQSYNAAQIGNRLSVDAQGILTIDTAMLGTDSIFTVNGRYVYKGVTLNAQFLLTVKNIVKLNNIIVTGSTSITERSAAQQFICTAYFDNNTSTIVTADPNCTWEVFGVPAGANITMSNVSPTKGQLTVTAVPGDALLTVKATYTFNNQPSESFTLNVAAVDRPVTLNGLVISGNNGVVNIYEGTSVQYTATASYSDGSFLDVTHSPNVTWELTTGTSASITSGGLLTVSTLNNLDGTDRINCSYTEGGTSIPAQPININLLDNYVKSITISGPTSVNENSQATFTALFTRRNDATVDGTATAIWSTNKGSMSGNTLSTPTNISATTDITVTASTPTGVNGTTVTNSKTIPLINVPLVLYPKYGVSALSITDGNSMNAVLSQILNTQANDQIVHFTPGSTGNVYCYFALPDTLGYVSSVGFQKCTAAGFPQGDAGGFDGATWSLTPNDPNDIGKLGGLDVTLITSGETHTWHLYRSDYPNLGDVYFKIHYSTP